MKATARLWVALVVGMAVVAIPARSWAGALSNTPISWDEFQSLANISDPDLPGPPYTDISWFEGGTEACVISAVFPGKGDAGGLYVYVYQIRVTSGPKTYIRSIAFKDLSEAGPTTVGNISSFYIGSGVPGTFLFGQGNKAPVVAEFTSPVISFSWQSDALQGGEVSYIVGFFSPFLPTMTVANLQDTGRETMNPLVYTPSPEPSVFLLLGVGLLGGALVRKRMKVQKA